MFSLERVDLPVQGMREPQNLSFSIIDQFLLSVWGCFVSDMFAMMLARVVLAGYVRSL